MLFEMIFNNKFNLLISVAATHAITLIRDLFTFSRKKMIKSHYPLDTVFVKKQYRFFLFSKDFFFYKDLPVFLKDFLHKILEFLYILQEQ